MGQLQLALFVERDVIANTHAPLPLSNESPTHPASLAHIAFNPDLAGGTAAYLGGVLAGFHSASKVPQFGPHDAA
jgi:hypothetical protein